MGSLFSEKWPWFLVGGLWLLIYAGGPLQVANRLKPRQTPEEAVRSALGWNVRLDEVVWIRPRRIGESGPRLRYRRPIVCALAISPHGSTSVAILYPHRGSANRPSVVTPHNPSGTRGQSFVGPAVLSACREARQNALPRWPQAVANAMMSLL